MGVVSQTVNPLDMCVSSPIHFITEYLINKYSCHLGGTDFYSRSGLSAIRIDKVSMPESSGIDTYRYLLVLIWPSEGQRVPH